MPQEQRRPCTALLPTEYVPKRQLQLPEHPVQLAEGNALLTLLQSKQGGRR